MNTAVCPPGVVAPALLLLLLHGVEVAGGVEVRVEPPDEWIAAADGSMLVSIAVTPANGHCLCGVVVLLMPATAVPPPPPFALIPCIDLLSSFSSPS